MLYVIIIRFWLIDWLIFVIIQMKIIQDISFEI